MSSEQGSVSRVNSDKPHRNLIAWQKTMDLAVMIYEVTRKFPREEIYALTSQLRRAAISAPSNNAEGAAGRTNKQFYNYLSSSIGSLNEIDTQLELGLRLGYTSKEEYDRIYKLMDACLALTYGLRKSFRDKTKNKRIWANS